MTGGKKQKRPRRSFTDEFKAGAVRLCPATAESRTRSSSRRFSGALRSAQREPFRTAASAVPLRSRASVRRTLWTASPASFTTWNGSKAILARGARFLVTSM